MVMESFATNGLGLLEETFYVDKQCYHEWVRIEGDRLMRSM